MTAAEWYRKAAEGGSVEGMKLLSFASRTGYGAVKSNAEAFNWMQRAADAGDAEERRRARRNGAADRQLISVTDDSKGAGKHAKK